MSSDEQIIQFVSGHISLKTVLKERNDSCDFIALDCTNWVYLGEYKKVVALAGLWPMGSPI